MLIVINYKVGNLGSISNMLSYLGVPHKVSGQAQDILQADRLILPGVGSFDYGMNQLRASGLVECLNTKVNMMRTPILGICLGMQLMCSASEEGDQLGLGWFDATVERFNLEKMDKMRSVPHTGWNGITVSNNHWVSSELPLDPRFYFVHTYHAVCRNPSDVWMTSEYGYVFASAIAQGNKAAVQFHPEKSHKYGLALLKKFSEWSHVSE
jgi:glutamine amidotransferase